MIIVVVGNEGGGAKKVVKLSDLKEYAGKDENGNVIEKDIDLSQNPEQNLVFDHRPIMYDRYGYTFEIDVDSENVTFTRTDKDKDNGWRDDVRFRLYMKTEQVKHPPFDNSIPYVYHGLIGERDPFGVIHVKVHKDVDIIRHDAFSDCSKLQSCDMKESSNLTEIEYTAFIDCHKLTCVRFPQQPSLEKIGDRAFFNCHSMQALFIPPSVAHIGEQAYADCYNLKVLKLPADIDLNNVDDSFIEDCAALEDAIPNDRTTKEQAMY